MIKKYYLIALFTVFFCQHSAHADGSRWGVGVIVGEPTAFTAENEMSETRSLDFGLGYSWRNSVLLYGDYLFHFPGVLSGGSDFSGVFKPYLGVGPELSISDSDHRKHINDQYVRTVFRARIPFGLGWYVSDSIVKVFVELVPKLNLIPGLSADFGAGIGARIYF